MQYSITPPLQYSVSNSGDVSFDAEWTSGGKRFTVPQRMEPMTRQFPTLLWAGAPAICLLAGCLNPYRTQLPTLWSPRPNAAAPGVGTWARNEGRREERHDPLPSTEIGPKLFTRPREYANPRADTRRFQEERLRLRGTTGGGYVTPPPSAYEQSYGNAVR